MQDDLQPSGETRLGTIAKWFGIFNVVLCGLLFVFILLGFITIPQALIPVGVFGVGGAILSGLAMRKQTSQAARFGLLLSLVGPLIVIVCYAIGLVIFWR